MKPIGLEDNFIYLTFALILLLLGTALAQQFFDDSAQRFMQSTTVITLLFTVWGVESKKFQLKKAFIFPVSVSIVSITSSALDNAGFDQFYLLLLLSFFIFTAIKTAKQVLFAENVDTNKILGAICLYLLLGLIWAVLYTLIQLQVPESFESMQQHNQWFMLFPDFVYFSFITMTTVGFGDISPSLPLARFLAYFEAVVGQFYLAILVASLVGSRMTSLPNKHN